MEYPQLANFFEAEYALNRDQVAELISSFQLRTYLKGTALLREEAYERKLRFLNSGVVREYYGTTEKEVNINFYTHPQFISDFTAFMRGQPSKKYQEALSPVDVLELEKEELLTFLKKNPHGKRFIERCFQRILQVQEAFEYNRMTKAPEDLYRDLRIYKPDWLQLIPQYHIAAFLGITPETLSRIRKRIS
ncbi:MAG: Crp/Fnr family transcriptional regulator [Bacteroidota bacterium]